MKAAPASLDEFRDGMRDLREAELRVLRLFPMVAEAVESIPLQQLVERYLRRCGPRLQRLDMILDALKEGNPDNLACRALGELARLAELAVAIEPRSLRRDVTLLACLQAIIQAKLDASLTMHALAMRVGFEEAADVLHESIGEESGMDRDLAATVERLLARPKEAAKAAKPRKLLEPVAA